LVKGYPLAEALGGLVGGGLAVLDVDYAVDVSGSKNEQGHDRGQYRE